MIYLLLGPEEGEKSEWLNKEKERIKKEHPDVEISTFFGGDEDGSELANVLSQSSLFSSFRLVIIKHYENVKKTDAVSKVIENFALDNQEDAEWIILSSEPSTSFLARVVGEKEKNTTLKFWELDDDKKKSWIRLYAKKEGFLITNQAIDEILSSVENNTSEMKNLVSSIISFLRTGNSGRNTIDIDDIENYTTRVKGENGFTLFKAVADRNLEKSLLIVSSILLSDSRDAIPAFTVLINQFRLLEACLEMKGQNIPERDIFKNVSYVQTSASARKTVGIFFKDQDTFRRAMRNYSLFDTRAIILYASGMDSEIKSAGDMLRITLENAIYNIIVNKGRKIEITLDAPGL